MERRSEVNNNIWKFCLQHLAAMKIISQNYCVKFLVWSKLILKMTFNFENYTHEKRNEKQIMQ